MGFGTINATRFRDLFVSLRKQRQFFLKLTPWSSHLLHFVLDGQLDAAEAGSVVGARRTQVDVAVQNGLHFLCVSTEVQNAHDKVLALHRQLAVVILQERVRREKMHKRNREQEHREKK